MLRASKVLSHDDWMGRGYESFFGSTDELAAYLREIPVAVVLLDLSTRKRHWFAHHDLLRELLEGRPETWRPVAAHDVVRDGVEHPGALLVFEQIGHADLARRELSYSVAVGER